MPGQEGFISFNTWTALFFLLNTVTMFLVLKKFRLSYLRKYFQRQMLFLQKSLVRNKTALKKNHTLKMSQKTPQ